MYDGSSSSNIDEVILMPPKNQNQNQITKELLYAYKPFLCCCIVFFIIDYSESVNYATLAIVRLRMHATKSNNNQNNSNITRKCPIEN